MDNARAGLLNFILNSTHDAIVAVDSAGDVLVFNRAAEKLIGKQVADVLGSGQETFPTQALTY